MGRSILAVVAGALLAFVLVYLIEGVGHVIYPIPTDLDINDSEAIARYVKSAPIGALLFVLIAWAVGTFFGALLAAQLAIQKQIHHALIVGVLMLLGGVMNLLMIPHPLWFAVIGVILFLPFAYLGGSMAAKKSVN